MYLKKSFFFSVYLPNIVHCTIIISLFKIIFYSYRGTWIRLHVKLCFSNTKTRILLIQEINRIPKSIRQEQRIPNVLNVSLSRSWQCNVEIVRWWHFCVSFQVRPTCISAQGTGLTCTSKCVVVSCGCGGPCCCCCCCCCEGGGPCGGGGAWVLNSCECGSGRWWAGGAWWCCRWCGGAGANAAMKCSSLPTTSTPGFSSTTPPPPALTANVAAFFWNSSSPGDGWRLPGVRLQREWKKNQL